MTRRRYDKFRRRPSRVDRIEQKCDRILSELLIVRSLLSKSRDDIDATIEQMHKTARCMNDSCIREREAYRLIFSKAPERWK